MKRKSRTMGVGIGRRALVLDNGRWYWIKGVAIGFDATSVANAMFIMAPKTQTHINLVAFVSIMCMVQGGFDASGKQGRWLLWRDWREMHRWHMLTVVACIVSTPGWDRSVEIKRASKPYG